MQFARSFTGIDAHAHVFERGLPLAPGRRYAPNYDATPETYLAMLERIGLSHGVIVQPSFLGLDNSYLLRSLDAYPDRLRGIVQADPVADLVHLKSWHARGVVGVRANLIGVQAPAFDDPDWQTFLRAMADLDWHLEVQAEADRLQGVVPSLLRSGVRVVIDHFGRVDPALGIADPGFADLLKLAAHPTPARRIWVKISGVYRLVPAAATDAQKLTFAATAYAALRDAYGVERLVWGSDWPHTQFEATQAPGAAAALRDAIVTDSLDRRALFIDTPAELFHFSSSRAS